MFDKSNISCIIGHYRSQYTVLTTLITSNNTSCGSKRPTFTLGRIQI